MAQLGLKLEQELAQLDTGKGLDARMAAKWGAEETKRECSQWQPVRSMQLTEEADVATARVVDIEDVEDFLIDLGKQGCCPQHGFITFSAELVCLRGCTLTERQGLGRGVLAAARAFAAFLTFHVKPRSRGF